MGIFIKRVYEPVGEDGIRILVDRLWPRGLKKEELHGLWFREISPSAALRKWFNQDPDKWPEFKNLYFAELDGHPQEVEKIITLLREGSVTLLYASRERERNQAVALRQYLEMKG